MNEPNPLFAVLLDAIRQTAIGLETGDASKNEAIEDMRTWAAALEGAPEVQHYTKANALEAMRAMVQFADELEPVR